MAKTATIEGLKEFMAKIREDEAAKIEALEKARKEKLAEIVEDLRKQETSAIEGLRNVRSMLLECGVVPVVVKFANGSGSRKSSGGSGTRSAKSAGKNEGKTVVEALHEAIKSAGGKADGATIRAWFQKKGDERTLNLSAYEAQGALKRVGDAPKVEGQKGRAGGLYAVPSGKA